MGVVEREPFLRDWETGSQSMQFDNCLRNYFYICDETLVDFIIL